MQGVLCRVQCFSEGGSRRELAPQLASRHARGCKGAIARDQRLPSKAAGWYRKREETQQTG